MRLLHTSDWHIGRTIRGRSRSDEFQAVLRELVGIAVQERVDAVLMAGDVYDHRVASPDSDMLVFDAFLRLYEANIPVVVIPGNHDSPLRLQALAALLRSIHVYAVPRVAPPDQGSVVEIASRDGSATALVACVPFVPERRFGDAARLFESVESWYQSYAENLGALLSQMALAFRGDRLNILMGHLFTDGALLGGGEREVQLGIDYAISPTRLPGTATYIALGHVHKPQVVPGSPSPARYSGSLLQLDFGEVDQAKSVCIVDASPGKPAQVRNVALSSGRKLLKVSGTIDELRRKATEFGDAYLHVTVNTDGPAPTVADDVREAMPNAVDVQLDYPREDAAVAAAELAALEPLEQYVTYYRVSHGVEPRSPLVDAFNEVFELEREGH